MVGGAGVDGCVAPPHYYYYYYYEPSPFLSAFSLLSGSLLILRNFLMCVACSELCFFLPRYIIRDSTFSSAILNNAQKNHAYYLIKSLSGVVVGVAVFMRPSASSTSRSTWRKTSIYLVSFWQRYTAWNSLSV